MKIAGLYLLILSLWLCGANLAVAGDERVDLFANLFAQIDGARNAPDSADHWRRPRMCGPIALYAYLRLHGRECNFCDISKSMTIDPARGTSFLDIQRSAARFGVESQIIRIPDGDLTAAPLPAIAHLSVPREGHYVVLLKVAQHEVLVADPISGIVEARDLDLFRGEWSGVLMVSKSRIASMALIEISMMIGIFGAGYIAFLTWRKARYFRVETTSRLCHVR